MIAQIISNQYSTKDTWMTRFFFFRQHIHIEQFLMSNIQTLSLRVKKKKKTNFPFLTHWFPKTTDASLLRFTENLLSPVWYKMNSITTLINRSFNICSTWIQFDDEIKFIVNYFKSNDFIKLPYLGDVSFTIHKQLREILKHSFPQINNIVLHNPYTANSLSRKRIPRTSEPSSNIVYIFNCPRCNARYIGSFTPGFKHRILEHMGKSDLFLLSVSIHTQKTTRSLTMISKFCLQHLTNLTFSSLNPFTSTR